MITIHTFEIGRLLHRKTHIIHSRRGEPTMFSLVEFATDFMDTLSIRSAHRSIPWSGLSADAQLRPQQ